MGTSETRGLAIKRYVPPGDQADGIAFDSARLVENIVLGVQDQIPRLHSACGVLNGFLLEGWRVGLPPAYRYY